LLPVPERCAPQHGTLATPASCNSGRPRELPPLAGFRAARQRVETGTCGAVNYGLLLAGAVIAMIPCIVVCVALQRYYVRGLISGALKG
jgi:ABC-type glycerol-3-phosphate transport system permease component